MASLKALKIRIGSVKSMQKITKAMAITAALAAACCLGGTAVAKDGKPSLILYKKDSGAGLGAFGGKLLHSYGYKDKQLDGGAWQITGQAKSDRPQDSQAIAVYRAAELAQAKGKQFVRIVAVNGKPLSAVMTVTTANGTYVGQDIGYGTRFVMDAEFTDTAEADACANDVLRVTCRVIDAGAAMREIRPMLKISA